MSVQWQNQDMSLPPDVDLAFVNQALWVNVQDDPICWIEVGDYYQRQGDRNKRSYYWAETNPMGYFEYPIRFPPHPETGEFQRYTINRRGGEYRIYIREVWVGTSSQKGFTQRADAGVEANDPNVSTPLTQFRWFIVRPVGQNEWFPWPNRTQHTEDPAYWLWEWPKAWDGFN